MNLKKLGPKFIIGLIVGLVLAEAWMNRATIRDAWTDMTKPSLPVAQEYRPQEDQAMGIPDEDDVVIPSTPQAPSVPSVVPDREDALPAEVNLAVPFLLQAPHQNWEQPFGDACEEASLIMVDAFYRGRTAHYAADEGAEAILRVVAFEDETFGHNKDTTTEEVARTAREFFGYKNVSIRPLTGPEDLKRVLAQGYPVIVPAYGKALGNPNFRNGGPNYHMLVVKGYTKDGKWITNDPGTRRGADYVYTNDVLMNAIHSFHPEDMRKGAREFIVVMPNS